MDLHERAKEIYEQTRRKGWDPSWVNASWQERRRCLDQATRELNPELPGMWETADFT